MELNNLRPAKGAIKSRKRIARGQGSGRGGTSTKGHNGAKSRSGHKTKRHFEGGQMPLQMRLPKIGFKNVNRVEYVALNLSTLEELAEKYEVTEINAEFLRTKNIVKRSDKYKILGNGELTKQLNVSAHAISKNAAEKIAALGGSVTNL
ncbi:MAG TPA: 50S ribosomal protein L15 [Saprospiraceae bacterium]|nr:50S ribosomal protein L15 [Saprospiraceae bacterium]HQW54687.1 50S ribosomal protein L15 [Saprospiraceae bacterium]